MFVDEDHSKLPTLNWLPKLHKRPPYKARFVANSSVCTTIELSLAFLAITNQNINIVKQYLKGMVKIYFGLINIQARFLIN